ncbi:MAG TPA: hypothetical protein H9662_01310 [Firmicutes bacterium]|nr:hypothetical protein [Bacillota bacterium]
MSIERMSLINIMGSINSLDRVLELCCNTEIFHPEMAAGSSGEKGFRPMQEENPYSPLLQRLMDAFRMLSVPAVYSDYGDLSMDVADLREAVQKIWCDVTEASKRSEELKNSISMHEQVLAQVNHLQGLNVSLDDIVRSKYSVARFGKLPKDSYLKLSYFEKKNFFFFDFDHDEDYYWGVYFAPEENAEEIEELFASLYFEEIKLPDYAHGTPQIAAHEIEEQLDKERGELEAVHDQLRELGEGKREEFQKLYSYLKMKNDTFAFRRYAVTAYRQFHLEGFVPKNRVDEFMDLFQNMEDVICEVQPEDADARLKPPVKLKTNWFFRPFEMFVTMYGLPDYYDVNPTSFIGFIYVLLFGVMFGDLGQGLILVIGGYLFWRFKKMQLGAIVSRCGISSMVFGTVYGSVFGFENLLDPMFHALGFAEKPIDVFESQTTNMLLISVVGIGVIVVASSIIMNIYLGLRKKNYESAVFSNNGIAGLVLYLGTILAAVLMLVSGINLFHPLFILLVIVLPLLLMALKEPLARLCEHKRGFKPEGGVAGFIMQTFFELFEMVLSYVTNTLSFLRVGGFVLSHAGMMAVVMMLAEMVGTVGNPIVVVIGNLFVMVLEGLLVGIQVLRLVFYETFSRFYEGDGKPYVPAKVEYGEEEN